MDNSKKKIRPIIIERKSKRVHETYPETTETEDENVDELDPITAENVEETDPVTKQSKDNKESSYRSTLGSSLNEIDLFRERIGEDVLIVLEASQLNILGQVFRPIFTGRIVEVTVGSILLEDVIIKMPNAPFFQFPTPLSFPIQKVVGMTRFDPTTRIPIL
ncbi:hypothetical protein [Halalkalibacter sp. APA_J-10(15)]|uniref:hypothetical protein n=1 Tax=Halalkalibacter sp. APA_J-10(15) TaxID=2933805 RepID=UPI001FF6F5E7|nr:hypothetical protein [Halalkalibacter sp. APA_J-10(15)]MCK0472464.1 hypothetical protein [Halalkalibacter sp. APA_J-10(15)]